MVFFICFAILLILSSMISLFVGVHNAGTFSNIIIALIIILICVFRKRFMDYAINSTPAYVIQRIARVIAILFVIDYLVLSACMAYSAYIKKDNENTAGCCIILGCKVKNGRPSKMLMQRINQAKKVYDYDKNTIFIATGGKGSDEAIPEGKCIKDELIKLGVPEKQIISEEKSTTTDENFKFAKDIIYSNSLIGDKKKVKIVTNSFHMFRSMQIAKKYGFKAYSSPCATSFYLIPTFWTREVLALNKFYLDKIIDKF